MSTHLAALLDYVDEKYPRCREGISEAMRVDQPRFTEVAETALDWAQRARGPDSIARAVDAYAQFTTDVNLAQARYERTGAYEHSSFAQVYENHYSRQSEMDTYLWGIYLTNFLWAHHMEIWQKFDDEFVRNLPEHARLFEIAPGHGCWGVWALHKRPTLQLTGYDISATSIEIASSVARAAGVQNRAAYEQRDALDLSRLQGGSADASICCFLIEHLEQPLKLFEVIHHLLRVGGRAFVTGALTAAQIDHIYEFRHESELVRMAERTGLRVLQTCSTNPRRTLPRARFIPRSMALLVEKPRRA